MTPEEIKITKEAIAIRRSAIAQAHANLDEMMDRESDNLMMLMTVAKQKNDWTLLVQGLEEKAVKLIVRISCEEAINRLAEAQILEHELGEEQ